VAGNKSYLDQWYRWPCAVVRSKPNEHPHRVSLYCNNVAALCSKWLQHNQSRAESGSHEGASYSFSSELGDNRSFTLRCTKEIKQTKRTLLSWQARQRDH